MPEKKSRMRTAVENVPTFKVASSRNYVYVYVCLKEIELPPSSRIAITQWKQQLEQGKIVKRLLGCYPT